MKILKPIEIIRNEIHNINGEFLLQWQQMIFQVALQIKKDGYNIIEALDEYSGGGCHHFHMRTQEGIIYSLHSETMWLEDENENNENVTNYFQWHYEKSYNQYKSIKDYYKDEDFGFGYEYNNPNYDERCFNMESLISYYL